MIRAGITGGDSAAAGELIRILVNHPDVDIVWITSVNNSGVRVDKVHRGLLGDTEHVFVSEPVLDSVDVVFCCDRNDHGAKRIIETLTVPGDLRIIDLSGDYNLNEGVDEFVYGLPELNRKKIVRGATRIAVPGAVSTVVQLALLPLARKMLLDNELNMTVVDGRGESEDYFSAFLTDSDSVGDYDREGIAEIKHAFSTVHAGIPPNMNILFLSGGGHKRGVMAIAYFDCNSTTDDIVKIYEEYYDDHNFVYVVTGRPSDFSDVVNTNKCVIGISKVGGKLVVSAVIDSLLKGAAGSAVHNMNLLFGLSEKTGLSLKSAKN